MTEDNGISPLDISCLYAAKQIAEHHKIVLPSGPRWMRKYHGDTEHEDKQFRSAGLETRAERDSWILLNATGKNLSRMVRELTAKTGHTEVYRDNFEVLFLHSSIEQAIDDLEARYWIPVDGSDKPNIVAHSYPDNVMDWLCHQVYERRDRVFNFLDSVDLYLYQSAVKMRPAERPMLDIHVHSF
ncbi:MAG: hypothetical protein V1729_05480 [Candidatus Woesearchaeota archaeon]